MIISVSPQARPAANAAEATVLLSALALVLALAIPYTSGVLQTVLHYISIASGTTSVIATAVAGYRALKLYRN